MRCSFRPEATSVWSCRNLSSNEYRFAIAGLPFGPGSAAFQVRVECHKRTLSDREQDERAMAEPFAHVVARLKAASS